MFHVLYNSWNDCAMKGQEGQYFLFRFFLLLYTVFFRFYRFYCENGKTITPSTLTNGKQIYRF